MTNLLVACFYTLMTFVLLDIGSVVWSLVSEELNVSYALLNHSIALAFAGLAVGCWMVIPMAHRFGRRPVYILSCSVQLAGAIWQAKVQSGWEILVSNLVCGLGGAISETVVQMTISDLFFVHERATINALYLLMVYAGAYLGPVAAGYIAVSQGWRWIWWWCVILLAVSLVLLIFAFEESKYIVPITGQPEEACAEVSQGKRDEGLKVPAPTEQPEETHVVFPRKLWRQRLALVTPTNIPLSQRYYQPFIILITFPAVAYTALMYGALLAWFSILFTTQSQYLVLPPWNFSASGIGLFSISGFIGTVFGAGLGGPINDNCIIMLSKRNGGIYEPEMRLWLNLLPIVLCPTGIFLYGIGLANVSTHA